MDRLHGGLLVIAGVSLISGIATLCIGHNSELEQHNALADWASRRDLGSTQIAPQLA